MKRLLFLCLLAIAIPAGLVAQGYNAPDVTISVEKANIAGKVYYIHKVLPKQTVFSICKAYGVTQEELMTANPDLKNGLKSGSIVFVPYKEGAIPAQQAQQKKAPAPAQAVDKPTETPAEPAVDPANDTLPRVVERVIEHKVRWFESLSSIARKYGLTPGQILDYNGMVSADEIRGKIILIPFLGDVVPDDDEILDPEEITPEEEPVETPAAPMMPTRKLRYFTADDPMRIALVLPLNASGKGSEQFFNFYSGALLAIRDMKDRGAHLVLNVYDLAQGANAIVSDRKFAESDLIIGPVESATLTPFLAFSDQNGIPIVSPLDRKVDSLVEFHPFLFQVPASLEAQAGNLVNSLNFKSSDRVILLTRNAAQDAELLARIETSLQAQGISCRKTGLSGLADLLPSGSRLSPSKVIIGSEDKAFATEAVRTLNNLTKRNIPLEVWCTNRVRNYETSDPDALFNIGLHSPAPYFVDYSDPRDQQFVRQYRSLYYAEPDDFSFQGYDIFTYFITVLMQQGTGFFLHPEDHPMQLLHCNFHFVRDHNESGWRNRATRNLVYDKDSYTISVSK
ncbi:MAG: LysM peptidoglycan-binding domain-containing protein [Bacteroidales bacterium]|nr:LysM peptidoglycan-binding domain-containing protein [Bacteroidales bacterium]